MAIGGKVARVAGHLGLFEKVRRFFPEGRRLARDYAKDDGPRGGAQLARTMDNVRHVIDKYGIQMNKGGRSRSTSACAGCAP